MENNFKRSMLFIHNTVKTLIVLPLVCLILSACGGGAGSDEPDVTLESINISLDSDANLSSATSIDLVLLYDVDLLKALLKLSASDYFASSDQIVRDNPEIIDVAHWELTPGQTIHDYPIPERSESPIAALIFSDYLTPGTHRLRVGSKNVIHVRLRKYDFCILEQGCVPPKKDKNSTLQKEKVSAINASLKKRDHDDDTVEDPLDKLTDMAIKAQEETEKASSLASKAKGLGS